MTKNHFLLVNLNEPRTKKLAETITSDTSRRILDHLTEKEDTEANIAQLLQLPISTVHYHLQKLKEAGLVLVEEFHYSKKGREVSHYKLANKYIIIAPKGVSGLREKLKTILPTVALAAGISVLINYIHTLQTQTVIAAESMTDTVIAEEAARALSYVAPEQIAPLTTFNPATLIFLGSILGITLYIILEIIIKKLRKIKEE